MWLVNLMVLTRESVRHASATASSCCSRIRPIRRPFVLPQFAVEAAHPYQSGQCFSTVTGMICSQKQGSPHSDLRHRLRNLSFFWDHAAATTCPALPHTLAAEESLSGKKSGAETGTRSLHHPCTALIYLGRLSDYHQCFKSSTFFAHRLLLPKSHCQCSL